VRFRGEPNRLLALGSKDHEFVRTYELRRFNEQYES
jgi:hypothetical protein